MATCAGTSLSRTQLDPDHEHEMIFTGTYQNHSLRTLFDTGSQLSFITLDLCKRLMVNVHPPTHKAVRTATGVSYPILGRVTFSVRWGPIKTDITAHVLSSLLPGIDLIAGQDFLNSSHAVLDYNKGHVSLTSRAGRRTALRASSTRPVPTVQIIPDRPCNPTNAADTMLAPDSSYDPSTQNWGNSDRNHRHSVSAAKASRWINAGAKTYFAMVQAAPDPLSKADLSHVPPDLLPQFLDILHHHGSLFADDLPPGLPPNMVPCEVIPLEPGTKVIYRHPYRLSPLEKLAMEKAITRLLRLGHIEPSTSPYGCPTFFVEKPNAPGELRQVFNYQAINAHTIKNRFPLPRIDDLIDSFQGATVFSSFDLTLGYNQLRLQDSDVPKSAFCTPLGHYHWRVLSLGLSNAPSAFQMAMRNIFDTHIQNRTQNGFSETTGYASEPPKILCYLDDICVLSSSPDIHLLHLKEVMDVMQNHHLICKLKKCAFFKPELLYLGHVITTDGVKPDPRKLQALIDWPFPTTVKQLQGFLGLSNYFRKIAPNYSRVSAPLHDLTKKGIDFAQQSQLPIYRFTFERIKQIMAEQPILALPNPDLPYELISDASITGCGAVLVQNGHPIAYFSAKYTPQERNYTTWEHEMLGVIKALQEFRCYLEGCNGLTIITDHNPLTHFPATTVLSRRQARWVVFLSRFNFTWKHIPGVTNPADGLSRLHVAAMHVSASESLSLLNSETTLSPTHLEWATFLSQFPNSSPTSPTTSHHCCVLRRSCALNTILELNKNFISDFPAAYQEDTRFRSSTFTQKMTSIDGFWYYKDHRLVVPQSMQQSVMEAHHSTAFSGHFGTRRTADLITRSFYWPGMHSCIKSFCQSCPHCQANKASTQLPYGLLQPIQIPDERWDVVCLDFITGLPRTSRGHDSILVFIDKLTKMVHLAPCKKTITAKEASHLFTKHVWSQHGSPLRLISDRDKLFTSDFWGQFCSHLGIKPTFSTAFHPQTDAQTERSNRTIEEVLRSFTSDASGAWDDLLPYVEFSMNNSKNASTQETPFFLNSGKHPRTPVTNQLPNRTPGTHVLPSIESIFRDRDEVLLRVRRLLQAAQDRQKHYADSSRRQHPFAAGHQVLLSTTNFRFQGKGRKKLYPKFVGPFPIDSMVGLNAAKLQLPADWRIHNVFHVSLLRPYVARSDDTMQLAPPPATPDGSPGATIEAILHHKDVTSRRKTTRQYLLRWAGYSAEHDSWATESEVPPSLIDAYSRSALGQRGGQCEDPLVPSHVQTRARTLAPVLI